MDWIELKPNTKREKFARAWMEDPHNKSERPIGGNRVAEAFSWLVTDLLSRDGIVGLVLPATSFFNLESREYRQHFFAKNEALRTTDFANLRDVLFDKRGTLPAATVVYRRASDTHEGQYIIHYGPFSVNQISGAREKPWVITVNEKEIQTIPSYEATTGETSLWKFALWGTYHDKRSIERIRYLFPSTLQDLCRARSWPFYEGVQLRSGDKKTNYELEYIADLRDKKRLQTDLVRKSWLRFSISHDALEGIPEDFCYVRKRGGKAGLSLTQAPHIILSPAWMSYIIYSDVDFVVPPRTMCIKASKQELCAYARELRYELDDFAMGAAYHQVAVTCSDDLIECVIETTEEKVSNPIENESIKEADLTTANLLAKLSDALREHASQWVYTQRGLRLFEGSRIYIYKSPRMIDWTRTQALVDAGDIIGEAISTGLRDYDKNSAERDNRHYVYHPI